MERRALPETELREVEEGKEVKEVKDEEIPAEVPRTRSGKWEIGNRK